MAAQPTKPCSQRRDSRFRKSIPSASMVFARVYEQKPLTSAVLEVLNAEVSREDLKSDLEQIGYPNGGI
jgi:hypothetical protein